MRALDWIETAGATVARQPSHIEIRGTSEPPCLRRVRFDAGDAAAVLRLGMCSNATGVGECTLDGSTALARRPHAEGVELLTSLGATFGGSTLPIVMRARGIRGGETALGPATTGQFLSGLVLASPRFEGALRVEFPRPWPGYYYFERSLELLHAFGGRAALEVRGDRHEVLLEPATLHTASPPLEPDPSHRLLFACLPAILGGNLRIDGPGTGIERDCGLAALRRAGVRFEVDEGALRVTGSLEQGLDFDGSIDPDMVPPLAVAAVFAPEPSRFANVARLRFKESDRLAALADALVTLGAQVQIRPSGSGRELDLAVTPPRIPSPCLLPVLGDHRLAMSYSLAVLAVPGARIDDRSCVAKSMADFFERLENATGRRV